MVRDPRKDPQKGDVTCERLETDQWFIFVLARNGDQVRYFNDGAVIDMTLQEWQEVSAKDEVRYVAK